VGGVYVAACMGFLLESVVARAWPCGECSWSLVFLPALLRCCCIAVVAVLQGLEAGFSVVWVLERFIHSTNKRVRVILSESSAAGPTH
jgi:hypothetical protein